MAGPTVTGMTPSTLARGSTATVTITGTNFGPGVKVVGPAGVVFDGVVRVNDTTITATVTVAAPRQGQGGADGDGDQPGVARATAGRCSPG